MRRFLLFALLGLAVAGCSAVEVPEELPEDHWSKQPAAVPFMKVGRGTVNIVAAPLDVPATISRVAEEKDHMGYALLAGTAEGFGNGFVRLFAGVAEILTFPLVNHSEPLYERRLGQPAFREEPDVTP
ncbi:MAG: hypothetical protein R6V58_01260 [Planctomycetota bacterium]